MTLRFFLLQKYETPRTPLIELERLAIFIIIIIIIVPIDKSIRPSKHWSSIVLEVAIGQCSIVVVFGFPMCSHTCQVTDVSLGMSGETA